MLYANAANVRQSAVDWSNFASSLGQATTWQNVGRLTSVRPNVSLPSSSWMQQNTNSLKGITAAAWPQPNTNFWYGLSGYAGFERAFTPGALLLLSVMRFISLWGSGCAAPFGEHNICVHSCGSGWGLHVHEYRRVLSVMSKLLSSSQAQGALQVGVRSGS